VQFKPITAIAVLLLVVASLLVVGCTSSTNSNQAASSASPTTSSAATKTANVTKAATHTATAKPIGVTPTPQVIVVTPTPVPPTPTPTPKHVTITVYYRGPPNNEAESIMGTLSEPVQYGGFGGDPYVTLVGVDHQTYNRIVGTTSTGQVQVLPWGDTNAVTAWVNAQLA
jgi:outer membrane murein-binding lipoprotein Lpp